MVSSTPSHTRHSVWTHPDERLFNVFVRSFALVTKALLSVVDFCLGFFFQTSVPSSPSSS